MNQRGNALRQRSASGLSTARSFLLQPLTHRSAKPLNHGRLPRTAATAPQQHCHWGGTMFNLAVARFAALHFLKGYESVMMKVSICSCHVHFVGTLL